MQTQLRQRDLVVALKLAAHPTEPFSLPHIAESVGISIRATNAAIQRLVHCRLFNQFEQRVARRGLIEVLGFAIWHYFPAEEGTLVRGVPTAWSAPPLSARIRTTVEVGWPHPDGTVQGNALTPLIPSLPRVAPADPAFYELLALTDAMRAGRPRERKLGIVEIRRILFPEEAPPRSTNPF